MTDIIEIEELGPQADGIHRSAQGPVYVDRALPGERVRVDVQRGSGGVLRGRLGEVLSPSPERIEAPCPHYDACGGCTIQHATEPLYRSWKVGLVRSAFARAGLSPERWHDPVFLSAGTRRRATFVAVKSGGRVTLGYFRRRSHQITEITTCLVLEPLIMELRSKLAAGLAPILRDGKPADVFIQVVDGLSELVITGPVGTKGTPDLPVHEAFAALAHSAKISRIAWRQRDRETPEVMLEVAPLLANFGSITVALPPLAFLQPTKSGERALIDAVMDALPKAGRFADLFSGCGTFAGAMLARGRVDAFENDDSAVRALDKAKGAKPLKVMRRNLYREPLQYDELAIYDAVVFDPPRAGALEQAKMLADTAVPGVIGVSCNPATFARDARVLVAGGYRLESVRVIDQFLWSHHIELVAAFARG